MLSSHSTFSHLFPPRQNLIVGKIRVKTRHSDRVYVLSEETRFPWLLPFPIQRSWCHLSAIFSAPWRQVVGQECFLSGVLSLIWGVYVDSFWELVLCLHPMGHRNTACRLGGKSLYLLSHFTNSTVFVLLLIFK